MLGKGQFMVLMGLSALVCTLVVANIVLFKGNRDAQNEFSTRTQYIQQTVQLEPIYQGVIRSLAELAAKHNDAQIRQLLASQGISFSVNPTQEAKK